MKDQNVKLPVELCGGPLDGHRDAVSKPEIDLLDMHLFGKCRALQVAADVQGKVITVTFSVERIRCAYRWANRTIHKGSRWVLEFDCVVSRWVSFEHRVINIEHQTEGEV